MKSWMSGRALGWSRLLGSLFLLWGSVFACGASFTPLGDLPGGGFWSVAADVSGDGTTVVGTSESSSGMAAFRWTAEGGIEGFGDLPGGLLGSYATAVSEDGSVVVGMGRFAEGTDAFRWTPVGGMMGLGDLPGGESQSAAYDVSNDGNQILGLCNTDSGNVPALWTLSGGWEAIADLQSAYPSTIPYALSGDGSTVVGSFYTDIFTVEAVRWTRETGPRTLGHLGSLLQSYAHGVSGDGTIVVGASASYAAGEFGYEAFRWTQSTGMVGLGDLSGGSFESWAQDVSDDGSVIVGHSEDCCGVSAFVWEETTGMRPLHTVLEEEYGLDLTGWELTHATGVSSDGTIVVGLGINPAGEDKAWMASLSGPVLTPTPIPTPLPNNVGWVEVEAQAPVSGMLLYGNRVKQDMAALSAGISPSRSHILPHFQLNDWWYTGVAVANPDEVCEAHVELMAYDGQGMLFASAELEVPPSGKVSKLLSDPSVFGAGVASGWLEVRSDRDVLVSEIYGNRIDGGISALSSCPPGPELAFPHFHCSTQWWTGVALANPNEQDALIHLAAYNEEGTLLGSASRTVPPRGRWVGRVDQLLYLRQNQTGWLKASSADGGIVGTLVFWDKSAPNRRIAASSAVPCCNRSVLANWRSRDGWWTGLSVANPHPSLAAQLTAHAWTSSGQLAGTLSRSLPPNGRMVGTVHDLFGLASESQGWIEIQADLAVAALGILSADIPEQEQSGLACVGCRPASEQPHLVHYATADPWWTQFCFANPQVDTVSMALRLFGNDGVPQGAPYLGLASRGGLALRAEELLPTHGRIW